MFRMLSKRVKTRVIGDHRKHEKDTGSAEVQIAMLSRQIDELAKHLKKNPKDHHSRIGLLKMVNQRRKLLDYLKKEGGDRYRSLIERLGLRK